MRSEPLEQAPQENPNIRTVIAPTERGDGVSAATPEPQRPEKKSRKAIYGAIGGVAGIAVIAASIIGIESANNQPDRQPTTSASGEPSKTPELTPTPTSTPEALTIQSAEIPAGLTPEQLGTAFIDRVSAWDMAGATADNRAEYIKAGAAGTTSDFLKQITEANGDIYAAALFGSDESLWQQPFVDNHKKSNGDFAELWFKTSAGVSKLDVKSYRTWVTADAVRVVSQGDGVVTLKIATTEHEELENRALQLEKYPEKLDGIQETWTVNFKTVGNVEQVVSFTVQ